MKTVFIEKLFPSGDFRFKWDSERSLYSFEIMRYSGFSLVAAKRQWRDEYGFKHKKIDFVMI